MATQLQRKVIVVFGATGLQGGSVARALLEDGTFIVRAVTRDAGAAKAQQLKDKGAAVVQANANDLEQVKTACAGAHGVFAVTTPLAGGMDAPLQDEEQQGKNMADAAKATGVQHFVYSTLENVTKRTGGKLSKVFVFDRKARVDEYIRALGIPASFVHPSGFLTNYADPMHGVLKLSADGQSYDVTPLGQPKICDVVDVEADLGAVVLGLFKNRDDWLGKTVPVTVRCSPDALNAALTKALGKPINIINVPAETRFPRLDPPVPVLEMLRETFHYVNEYEYYDPSRQWDFGAAEKLAGRPLTAPEQAFARMFGVNKN